MMQAPLSARASEHTGHFKNFTPSSEEEVKSNPIQELRELWQAYLEDDKSQAKRLQRLVQRTIDKTAMDFAEKQHRLAASHSSAARVQILELRRLERQLQNLGRQVNKKNFDKAVMADVLRLLEKCWAS